MLPFFVLVIYGLLIAFAHAQYIVNTNFVHDNADSYCSSHCHSELGSIHSEEQFKSIQSLSKHDPQNGIWIGLKANPHPTYKWSDGSSYDFATWAVNEPDSIGIECVAISTSFEWITTSCDQPKRFLCNHCNGQINKYLMLSTTAYSYMSAQSACAAYSPSSTLISIHSTRDLSEARTLCTLSGKNCWIGLNDLDSEGIYKYDDGTSFDFASDSIQFHHADQDCVHLSAQHNYTLTDTTCDGASSINYALCHLPSALCAMSAEWTKLAGNMDGDCTKIMTEASDIVIANTLWYNGPNALIIDYTFSFVVTDTTQVGSSGLALYNGLDGTTCTYYYVFVQKRKNTNTFTLALIFRSGSTTHIVSAVPITAGYVSNDPHLLSIHLTPNGNLFTIYLDDALMIHYQDMNEMHFNKVRHDGFSGYIGIKTSLFTTTTAHSLYIAGTGYPLSSSIDIIQASSCPTSEPTRQPTTPIPTSVTLQPTRVPTDIPTMNPSGTPTPSPTKNPSVTPTPQPSNIPTISPTLKPSVTPTITPTIVTVNPTNPSMNPTENPSNHPSYNPSNNPTRNPSIDPTLQPSVNPSVTPIHDPTAPPSVNPTVNPTLDPIPNPTLDTSTHHPSDYPSIEPTVVPTTEPTVFPTVVPSDEPTISPTVHPTSNPTTFQPSTGNPTPIPSYTPTLEPITHIPTDSPSDTLTPAPQRHVRMLVTAQLHFLVSYDRINIVFLLDDFFSSEEIDAFTWIMEESMNELIRGDCGYSNGFKTIRITEYPSKHQTIMNGSMITCDVSQESVLISEMMDASLQDMIIQNIKQETQRQIILSAKPTIKYKSATGNKYTATTGLEDTDTQSSDSGSQSWFSWILKFIVIQIGLCCLLLACFFGIKVRTKQIQTDKLAIEKQISESKRFTVTSTPQVNPNKDCQGLRSFLQSPRMEGVVNGTAPSPYRTGPYPMEQRKIVSSAPKFNNSGGISRFAMPNNQDIEEEDAAADEDEEMEMYEDGKVYARYIKQLMVKMRSNKKHDKVRSKNTVKTTSEVEMMSDYEAADIDGPFSFKSTYQMDPDDKTGLVHRIDTDTTFPSIPLHDMFSSSHNFTDTMGDNEDAMSGAETIHTQPQPQSVASDSDSDEEEDTMSYVELPKNRTNGVNASNREISSTTSTLSLGPPHKTSFVTICDKCGTTHPKNFKGVSCMHFAKFNNY